MGRRKKVGYASVSLVLVLGALVYVNFFLWLPTGERPAGPELPLAPFERVWSERPVLVLGLGDSVTAGFGARPGWGYFPRIISPPPDDWPGVQGRGFQYVYPNLEWKNISVSGSTSLGHARSQIPELEVQPEETLGLVFFTTGGNDLIHMYGRQPPIEGAMFGATLEQAEPWIANFSARLEVMLGKITERFPGGCHIFLPNIYDPSDGVGDLTRMGLPEWPDGLAIHARYNGIIAEAAERHEHVHLVDMHTPFLGHGIYCRRPWNAHHDASDPHYWYYANLEDPNERGYDAIRRLMLLKAIEVLAPDGADE